jgi:GH35 family endo-1,4-beta-xylanase
METEVLAQAQTGITAHRTARGRLVLVAPDGDLISGAELRVEQLRHAFLFGANCFGWGKVGEPPAESDEAYRRQFANLFNAATLGFYWHTYEPERAEPAYERTDRVAAWCREHGIVLKGHPLAWANLPDPAWLPADLGEIRAASLSRVRQIVSRFKGRIDVWDVVNEPSLLMWANTRLGQWAQSVGTEAYVRQHLEAARQANPGATLMVNEVLTQYPMFSLLDSLREESGRPLYDAVGIQSHMHPGHWSLAGTWDLCNRVARLSVPLHFSEVTVLSGERLDGNRWGPSRFGYEILQRDYVPELYTLLFGHPAVQSITWWDLSDRGAWKGAPGGLLRADMSPKPAYEQLHDLIKRRWWTQVEGETDAQGEFSFRAFYGRHRLTARSRDGREDQQEFDWLPGRENHVEIVLPKQAR